MANEMEDEADQATLRIQNVQDSAAHIHAYRQDSDVPSTNIEFTKKLDIIASRFACWEKNIPSFTLKMMDSSRAELLQAFERATVQLKFCPNRVWAVAGEDLPNLLPHVDTYENHIDDNKHELCTFDFCEYARRDFTSVPQRCECGEARCRKIGYRFPRRALEEAARIGKSTAWKLTGYSTLESPRPFMAVSHVWSDGTGAGSWREGEVNECLYTFFRSIAERFECEGIWWDTNCIPRDKAARTKAIRRMHINYREARVTLVHDLFLRNWKWDPRTACFAILMSPWFSRGWTALELAQSPKVKVIFKGPRGPVIKDLDEEILAKEDGDKGDEGDEHEMRRRRASQIIRNLRRRITSVNELLTVLGSRYTSWPKDLSVISALLVDVEPHESQQSTYMRVLRKIAKISPGHLFHNAATMSAGSSWCPTSLFSMPIDSYPRSSLEFSDAGIEGHWRVIPVDKEVESNFLWRGSHPLIKHHVQDTLKRYPDQCLLLAECGTEPAQRALFVRTTVEPRDTGKAIRCQYVGAVDLRRETQSREVAEVIIVHSDKSLSGQEEQSPMTSGRENGETLRRAIWGRDYAVFNELVRRVDLDEADELGRRPLHLAAERGQCHMIRELVHFGVDLDARCGKGQTALHHAAWGGSAEVVQLLKDNVDETARDNKGDMALHIAAKMGVLPISRILINDRTIDAPGSDNLTPLHIASMNGDLELANLLKDANTASKDSKFGWTPLHCAADSGNEQLMKLLIERGAKVDVGDDTVGWTPLHFAAINGHQAVADILLRNGANTSAKYRYGWTSREYAKENGHAEVFNLLESNGSHVSANAAESVRFGDYWMLPYCMAINNEPRMTKRLFSNDSEISFDRSGPVAPILLAAANGLETTIRKLLRNGIGSVQAATREFKTPLHWAAHHGHETLTRLLLETGAFRRPKASDGHRPLPQFPQRGRGALGSPGFRGGITNNGHTQAPQRGHGISGLPIQQGPHRDRTTGDSLTVLHHAAQGGHASVIHLLLQAGGDMEMRCSQGYTPLHYAARNGYELVAHLLLEAGADKEAKASVDQTPLHCAAQRGHQTVVQLLLEVGVRKDSKNSDGYTALHYAAEGGHGAVVHLLLKAGAKKEAKCNLGYTALHHAELGGHETVIRLLLEAGVDKEAKDNGDQTPLYLAISLRNESIVRILLEAGVDAEAKDSNGRTPLHYAAAEGHESIVQALIDAGVNTEAKDRNCETPLHRAVAERDGSDLPEEREAATIHVREGEWFDEESDRRKVLQYCAPGESIGGSGVPEEKYAATVRLLLKGGVDKDVKDNNGRTPIHRAAEAGYRTIVYMLLEAGADRDGKDNNGRTPLHWAAMEGQGGVTRLLLEVGAEMEVKDASGQTPHQVAAAAGHKNILRIDSHRQQYWTSRP